MDEHKAEEKSQTSTRRSLFECVVIFGKPYITKFFLFVLICALNFIFSQDAFSVSLNITLFLGTVIFDMSILENHIDFFKKDIASVIQFVYWIILLILLGISIIITLQCAANLLDFEQNPSLRNSLAFFVFPFGVISPFFEMVYSIHSDD